jgi:hypothetical protein
MHVGWWNVVVAVAVSLMVLSAISEFRSSPREARRLRNTLQGGAGGHQSLCPTTP